MLDRNHHNAVCVEPVIDDVGEAPDERRANVLIDSAKRRHVALNAQDLILHRNSKPHSQAGALAVVVPNGVIKVVAGAG